MTTTMPKQVFDALRVILDEFGDNDLIPRLEHFAAEEPEEGRQLLRAFNLVEAWSKCYGKRILAPDDIRDCLEESDDEWKSDYYVEEE